MWPAVLIVALGVSLVFGLRRWLGIQARRRVTSRIEGERIRTANGVSVAALVSTTSPFRGLRPHRRNRAVGDVVLTSERLVVATTRGVWVDVSVGKGRPLTAVKAPGPRQLVLEGDLPASDGNPGSWRVELLIDDAGGWAEAVTPFAATDDDGRPAVTIAPWSRGPKPTA